MIGAIVGDGARFATMSLWVMALALIAKGSVGIILRVPLKREWYPGLKDCRVLEYDTEQQVYG